MLVSRTAHGSQIGVLDVLIQRVCLGAVRGTEVRPRSVSKRGVFCGLQGNSPKNGARYGQIVARRFRVKAHDELGTLILSLKIIEQPMEQIRFGTRLGQ